VHWKPSDSSVALPPAPVKLVIAGGFGVGKTTTVAAISEIAPLRTEAAMTTMAAAVDPASEVPGKTTTTVALDFGCITLDQSLRLYLFGTPGQDRFGFMWNDIAVGALGALVIVDTRRMDDSYPAVDYFEHIGLPYVVGVNLFHGQLSLELSQVRWALAISEEIPLITFDARDRYSVRDALLAVLHHTRQRAINVIYR
jgi:signal recognition particle receptor subunit beta